MTLTDVHGRLSTTLVLYAVILGVWALFRFFRRQGPDSSYYGALVIAEFLALAQGVLGAILWLGLNLRPERGGVHLLYGITSLLVIPGIYAYTRGGSSEGKFKERVLSLIYGVALLFLAAIAIRGIATGG